MAFQQVCSFADLVISSGRKTKTDGKSEWRPEVWRVSEWKRDGRTMKRGTRDDVKGPIRCEQVVGQERLAHREGIVLWRSSGAYLQQIERH
jgi:hypothetical protein